MTLDGLAALPGPAGPPGPQPQTVRVGASIGLVVMDPAELGVTPDGLLARVDAAMYAAKRQGKSRLVRFHGERLTPEATGLVSQLRLALAGSPDPMQGVTAGIDVMYQPVVNFADGRVVALEALVRWRHPQHGTMPADLLVSVADDAGLLVALEERVLETACRDVRRLRRDPDLAGLAVHVNVSAQRTSEPQLVEAVRDALARHHLPGDALILEITETNRVPDLRLAAKLLAEIRGMGVRLALDDFGTGFSGLSYLLELPIDIVKLDKSLTVADLDSRGGTIRHAAIRLTLGLGLTLVAEGIETPEQAEELAALGCELGQGFLWSRPGFLAELNLTAREQAG